MAISRVISPICSNTPSKQDRVDPVIIYVGEPFILIISDHE